MNTGEFLLVTLSLGLIASPAASQTATQASPFVDAVAVWHMAGLEDSAGKNSSLAPSGDVKMGVELTRAERSASLERGGDGLVGGWVVGVHDEDSLGCQHVRRGCHECPLGTLRERPVREGRCRRNR